MNNCSRAERAKKKIKKRQKFEWKTIKKGSLRAQLEGKGQRQEGMLRSNEVHDYCAVVHVSWLPNRVHQNNSQRINQIQRPEQGSSQTHT